MDISDPLNPFIPFPPSHPNLRLTMPLYTDGKQNMLYHNDPRVYMFLTGPPHPYTAECWEGWWPILSSQSTTALGDLNDVLDGRRDAPKQAKVGTEEESGTGNSKPRRWVGKAGLPCTVIRDMGDLDENGIGKYLGSIEIRMAAFEEVKDLVERERLVKLNASYEAGDPRIAYEIGCESSSCDYV